MAPPADNPDPHARGSDPPLDDLSAPLADARHAGGITNQVTGQSFHLQPLYWPRRKNWFWRWVGWFPHDRSNMAAVRAQLANRSGEVLKVLHAWGDNPARRSCVAFLTALCCEELKWESTWFIPDDPWEILLYDLSLDLRAETVLAIIGNKLGVPWSAMGAWEGKTLGEIVDYLIDNKYWPPAGGASS